MFVELCERCDAYPHRVKSYQSSSNRLDHRSNRSSAVCLKTPSRCAVGPRPRINVKAILTSWLFWEHRPATWLPLAASCIDEMELCGVAESFHQAPRKFDNVQSRREACACISPSCDECNSCRARGPKGSRPGCDATLGAATFRFECSLKG